MVPRCRRPSVRCATRPPEAGCRAHAVRAFPLAVTTELSAGELATMFARVERDLALADADSALQVLVHSALDMVPGAQMAGVSVGRGGRFSTRAATDEAVRLVDQLQYDADSGPCVDAIVQDATFNARDLRTDPRWPEFGQAAFAQ